MENNYDVIIIGSGLGGLECAITLSKEGYKVCVVEQSSIFGGCLQSFRRKGYDIDTGIHYIGSMNDGQIMNQYFKYFGILDELDYLKLDDDFDHILLGKKDAYCYQSGHSQFKESLKEQFPNDRRGIEIYCDKIKQIGTSISVEQHSYGRFSSGDISALNISAAGYIEECVKDETLRNLLAGTNALYGGVKQSSNLYHHSMVNFSNIEGACRFVGGTQKVADAFVNHIRANGGVVRNKSKVVAINMSGDRVDSITLENQENLRAKYFISNIHPQQTFELVEKTPLIKKAYKSRLKLLPNTYALFSVYLVLKKNSFPYINHNIYYYGNSNAWDTMIDSKTLQPNLVLLSSQVNESNIEYGDVLTLLSPIDYSLFEKWIDSKPLQRGDEYLELKNDIAQNMINFVAQYRPDIVEQIEHIYTSSPLSYKNYTGTPHGSAYGILKDYRNSVVSLLPAKTKISNLFLTGQNLNVHGAIGVTLTSAVTCSELLGVEYLAKKIANA